MTEVFRTPEERFEGLPQFGYEPRYAQQDGLRLARVEAGEGPPVVLLHGEPAWSFVYRKVMPPLVDAGHRCIALDHAGFGRSDKPLDPAWHDLQTHVALTGGLLEQLDLRDACLIVHDWGGPIGLSCALEHPDRISRIVVLDTVIDPTEVWANEVWVRFREFVEAEEDIPVAELMQGTCVTELAADVLAGYDAPYPTPGSKVAMKGLPMSVPRDPDRAEIEGIYAALAADERPMLMIWGASDLILTLATGQRLATAIGRRIDHVVDGAGHGLPEERGELVGGLIAEWLRSG
jgi:haloalkane dehalogenase